MTEMTAFDIKIRRAGMLFAAVVFITIVVIFAIGRNSPSDQATSRADGYQSAAEVTVGHHPTRADIRSACRTFVSDGLSGNDATDQAGPFVQGCIQGVEHRLDVKASP
jgi:hypothetical protein